MPLARTPLEPGALSDAARKALGGPPPLRLMAARGLAPLPRPADLVSVIYQLALDEDEALRAAAAKTAAELPDKILVGALSDPGVDPRVLDFLAGRLLTRPTLLEALLLNRATADETIAELTPRLGESALEIVAQNEQRLLRHPAIVGALYMNPKARMSTVDRAVELAVRNKIQVPGIPAWDEVVAAVLGTRGGPPAHEEDEVFAVIAAVAIEDRPAAGGEAADAADAELETVDKADLPIDQLSIPGKVRLATIGNAFARAILIRDINRMVAMAAIKSPRVTDNEVVKFSSNRMISDDVIREIANTKEWTKLYQVKVNLVNNPKTPLPNSMRLLPFLHDKDLRLLAKAKSVPSALVSQAKKLIETKGGRA